MENNKMSGTKKVLLVILAVFVGIPATLMLIGFCVGFISALTNPDTYKEEVQTVQTTVPPSIVQEETTTVKPEGDRMPVEFINEAINGCAEEGADRSQCKCMFDLMDKELTNAEIWEFAELSVTDPDAAMEEAIYYAVRCI